MPVDGGGASGSEAGDSAVRSLARPGESGKGEGPARTFLSLIHICNPNIISIRITPIRVTDYFLFISSY